MSKQRARDEAKAKRQAFVATMTPAEQRAAAVLLAAHIEESLGDARVVAAYLPIGSEADTLPIINRLVQRDLAIALPHVTGRRGKMRFLLWAPGNPLPAGPMALRQPETHAPEVVPDVILTPLLAFDGRLHRLGYGAGHYDRAFAANPRALRIGVAWSVQRIDTIDDEAWDVPLHAVATELEYITT